MRFRPDECPLLSVDAPVVYPNVVACQAVFASRSRNAMLHALREMTPALILPRNDTDDDFVSCVHLVAGHTLNANAALLSTCSSAQTQRRKNFVSSSRPGPASHWSSWAPGIADGEQGRELLCSQQYCTSIALNMIDQASVCPAFFDKVNSLIAGLSPATLTTVFLFVSAQFIATKLKFVKQASC